MGVFALALRAPSNTPIARKFKTLPNTFAARFTLLLTAAHSGSITAVSDKLRGHGEMKFLMTVLEARQTAVQASERKAA